MAMTVLVTGGAGYIGSHMVHALVDAGERVSCSTICRPAFSSALPAPPMLPVVGDVGDQALVVAADRRPRRRRDHPFRRLDRGAGVSVRDPLGYYRNNTVNSRALIEAAVKGGVAISSSPRPPRSMAIRRACRSPRTPRLAPMSPYGWSKLMTEIMLRDAGCGARSRPCHPALFQRRRRRSASSAPASRRRTPPI